MKTFTITLTEQELVTVGQILSSQIQPVTTLLASLQKQVDEQNIVVETPEPEIPNE